MVAEELKELQERLKREKDPVRARLLEKQVAQWEAWLLDDKVDAAKYGYEDFRSERRPDAHRLWKSFAAGGSSSGPAAA